MQPSLLTTPKAAHRVSKRKRTQSRQSKDQARRRTKRSQVQKPNRSVSEDDGSVNGPDTKRRRLRAIWRSVSNDEDSGDEPPTKRQRLIQSNHSQILSEDEGSEDEPSQNGVQCESSTQIEVEVECESFEDEEEDKEEDEEEDVTLWGPWSFVQGLEAICHDIALILIRFCKYEEQALQIHEIGLADCQET